MPENTTTECAGDSSRNDPIQSQAATADIERMVEKLVISHSSNEESDASSEDGGSDATKTVQSLDRVQYNKSISTESSLSTVSDVSGTNKDRDQERERRSRSSSECSDSSSASSQSDSTPPKCDEEDKDLEVRFDNLKIVQADDSQQKVAEISERDVDSNCERTTDDSDDESSSDENHESEDTESESDGEEFTQRGPMSSGSKRSPPHLIKPYPDRNQIRNHLSYDRGDYYNQESRSTESETSIELVQRGPIRGSPTTITHDTPYNIPDSSVVGSSTGNEELWQQDWMVDYCRAAVQKDPEGVVQTLQYMVQDSAPVHTQTNDQSPSGSCFVVDVASIDLPTPSPQMGYMHPIRQSSSSIRSDSPVSPYSTETPSPENAYVNGPSSDVDELIGGMDFLGSPISHPSMNSPYLTIDSQDQSLSAPRSTSQLGRTPSTGVFNGGIMTVHTPLTTSMLEGQDQHTLNILDNLNGVELPSSHETISLIDMPPRVPGPVIPRTVLDIDNTSSDATEYARLLRSLDIRLTRSTGVFRRFVSLKSLRSNAHYLLDRDDEEFSAKNDMGNTYAMVMLSRSEELILDRIGRLAVTFEKMQRVPESFMAMNCYGHDLLYMAAINFGKTHPFIIELALQKTFKALGEKSEFWTRTYDRAGNTLLHVIIIRGQDYVDALRELLDVRTTGDQAVFSLTAPNVTGQTPWDLAVAADSQGSGNYTSITQLLENYRTPNVIGSNIVVNMAPNIPYTRQL